MIFLYLEMVCGVGLRVELETKGFSIFYMICKAGAWVCCLYIYLGFIVLGGIACVEMDV